MHQLVDLSPNWSYIAQTQRPTPELHGEVGQTYPRAQEVEENLIRQLGPISRSGNRQWQELKGGLTPTQKTLVNYLRSHAQYGPQWGSFWGPEYDERELRQGKGQNILPKFVFNPSPEDARIPGVPRREETINGWRQFLQYVSDLRGDENSRIIVDPTYRGMQIRNKDGTFSSERTMTFEDSGVHYIVPTLFGGQQLRPEDAFMMFKRGQLPAVGMAGTAEEAEKIAGERSKMLGLEGEAKKTRTIQRGQVVPLKEEQSNRDIYGPRWRDLVR